MWQQNSSSEVLSGLIKECCGEVKIIATDPLIRFLGINQYQGGTVLYRRYLSIKKNLALTEHDKYKSEKEKNLQLHIIFRIYIYIFILIWFSCSWRSDISHQKRSSNGSLTCWLWSCISFMEMVTFKSLSLEDGKLAELSRSHPLYSPTCCYGLWAAAVQRPSRLHRERRWSLYHLVIKDP